MVATSLFVGGAGAGVPAAPPDFGPNVVILDPGMSTTQIQTTLDTIAAQQVDNEFGTQRYSILFVSYP